MSTETQGILQQAYDPVTKALRVTSAGDTLLVHAGEMSLGTGPARVNTNGVTRVLLDGAGATESVFFSVAVPTSWATLAIGLYWSNEGAGAGNVRWQISTKVLVNADLITEAATVTPSTISAPAQNAVKRSDGVQNVTAVADAIYAIQIDRLSGDAADNVANDMGLIAVRIRQGGA